MAEQESAAGTELGKIEISDDVIKSIAGAAVIGIAGVAGMRGGVWVGIREATTGKRDYSKGIEVRRVGEEACVLDLYIIVDHNIVLSDVGRRVQEAVKEVVESKVGKRVDAVNVHVVDIRISEPGAGGAD